MLHYLKPQKIASEKSRLGSNSDGGYVVSDIALESCNTLMTYGYGGDKSYEDAFIAKYNKPVYLFDHTVNQDNWDIGDLHFISEGLGNAEKSTIEANQLSEDLQSKKEELINDLQSVNSNNVASIKNLKNKLNTLLDVTTRLGNSLSLKSARDHYNQLNLQGDVFLKIDIEGAELDYFNEIDIDDLASFTTGLIVEVHWIDQEHNRNKFISMLEKLSNHYVLTHIHGNNWGGEFDFEGHKVPRVPELSFVNKKLLTNWEPDNQSYPIEGLDFKNNQSIDDCDLSFLNTI